MIYATPKTINRVGTTSKKFNTSEETAMLVVLCAFVFVASFASVYGVRPFGTSLLVLCVVCGFGVFACPIYVIAGIICDSSTINIVFVLLQCLAVIVICFVSKKRKMNIVVVCTIMSIICGVRAYFESRNLFASSVSVVLCSGVFFVANSVFKDRKQIALTANFAMPSFATLAIVFGMGLYAIPYIGLGMFVFVGLGCVLVFCNNNSLCLSIAMALGLGVALQTRSLNLLAMLCIVALCVCIVGGSRWQKSFVALIGVIVSNLYFGNNMQTVVVWSTVCSCIVFVCIPNKFFSSLKNYFDNSDVGLIAIFKYHNSIVKNTSQVLMQAIDTLQEVCMEYFNQANWNSQDNTNNQKNICAKRNFENNGVLDILTKCIQVQNNSLSTSLVADSQRQEQIVQSLNSRGVHCSSAMFVSGCDNQCFLAIKDLEDSNTQSTIRAYLYDNAMQIDSMSTQGPIGIIHAVPMQQYDISFATKSVPKSVVCGDKSCFEYLEDSKFLMILCDGMGSGQLAQKISSALTTLVCAFKKCGLHTFDVLEFVNKFLMTEQEIYACVDIAIVDLQNGKADIIKLGSPAGYIRKQTSIRTLDGQALPLGLLEEMKPAHLQVQLVSDDTIVFCTDGITDIFDSTEFVAILEQSASLPPQQLCDFVMQKAMTKSGIQNDDMSIAVATIQKK